MKKIYAIMALCSLLSTTAMADIVTVDSEIQSANQVDYFSFSLTAAGAVNLYTSSLAPYNPNLTLWSASSSGWTQVAFNDDTTSWSLFESGSNPKDAQVKLSLSIGNYLVSISNSGNTPLGVLLSAGFSGLGTLQSPFAYQFTVDTDNVSEGAASIANLKSVPVSAVPLPGAAWMLMTGLMGVLGLSKRKKQ